MYRIRNGSLYCSNLNKTGNVRANVTLTLVRETIFTVEEQKVLLILNVCVCVCVCILSHPARKAQAPYYIVTCACLDQAYFIHI